jgi:hypothetical protein
VSCMRACVHARVRSQVCVRPAASLNACLPPSICLSEGSPAIQWPVNAAAASDDLSANRSVRSPTARGLSADRSVCLPIGLSDARGPPANVDRDLGRLALQQRNLRHPHS